MARKNTSRDGTKPGETRATFIVREDFLDQLKNRARSQGKEIKEIVNEALGFYLYLSFDMDELDKTLADMKVELENWEPPEPDLPDMGVLLDELNKEGGETMPRQVGDIRYYTINELSGQLEVSEQTLRKYVKQGKLRGQKIAGQWTITETALKDFMENRQ